MVVKIKYTAKYYPKATKKKLLLYFSVWEVYCFWFVIYSGPHSEVF